MAFFLAIDLGTSSLKAALYDDSGHLHASSNESYPLSYPHSGWVEQSPEDWWHACCLACTRILAENKVVINAVCVSGQAPACVPVDRQGKPLRPAIIWMDRRAAPQADRFKQNPHLQKASAQGLNTFDSYFGGFKWLWFQENEPDLYRQTWKILQPNGYILHKLTGAVVTDAGHAGICTPFYSDSAGAWSETLCDLLQFDMEKLPDIQPFTSVIGQVSRSAFEETHIPAGTPVVAGAPDFLCSCLGAGVLDNQSAALMLGTAGNLMFPSAVKADHRMLNTRFVNDNLISTGGVLAGGAVSWFCNLVAVNDPNSLEEEAILVQPGSEGVVFLPYLVGQRSPIWDPDARGVFMGLNNRHTRAHLYRAVLEGVAFSFLQMKEIMAEQGTHLADVIVIDGGARSSLWRQILADSLGLPVRWRANNSGTALGCAYLANMGSGSVKNFTEISQWLEPTIDTLPNPNISDRYQQNYQVFSDLYPSLESHFKRLAERL